VTCAAKAIMPDGIERSTEQEGAREVTHVTTPVDSRDAADEKER